VTLTVVSELEAEMLCGLLRAKGIDSSYRKTDLAAAASQVNLSMVGPAAILVHQSDFDAPRGLLPSS
jgi:hypothetical protein